MTTSNEEREQLANIVSSENNLSIVDKEQAYIEKLADIIIMYTENSGCTVEVAMDKLGIKDSEQRASCMNVIANLVDASFVERL
jgi:hypothetical protein